MTTRGLASSANVSERTIGPGTLAGEVITNADVLPINFHLSNSSCLGASAVTVPARVTWRT